ncbi:hypothetical protein PAMP_006321 [Pampus punctatissimus]
MYKMCVAFLGVFLLSLHLSSQVMAQNVTTAVPMNATMSNYTMGPMVNTTSKGNGCERTDASTLLLPLAVAATLLHSWS